MNLSKVGNPEEQAMIIAKGAKNGVLSKKGLSGMSKNYRSMFGGKTMTRIGALRDIINPDLKNTVKSIPTLANILQAGKGD
jgi:hypothetical protein